MLDERKFCGGAQRRTKRGVLHQGSIQGVRLPDDAGHALAETMAKETTPYQPPAFLIDQALDLAAAKYASADWNEMR
jgi:lipoate-protein ligase A